MRRIALPLIAIVALAPLPARAGSCECSRHIGLCQAETRIEGNRLSFNVYTRECAEVAYSVNDETGSISFQGGEQSIEYLTGGPLTQSSVSVHGCFICDAKQKKARGGYAGEP